MGHAANRTADAIIGVLLVSCASSWAAVYHVALDGDNTTGQDWATAFTSIQAVLGSPSTVSGDEIRVEQGTWGIGSSIAVTKAVTIQGGYSGAGETRDPTTYVSTIDGGSTVIHCFQITADATIDGLTITGGNATGTVPSDEGGGMYISNCDPTINNCVFQDNHADYRGGAICANFSDNGVISNCFFTGNSSGSYGGAIHNYDSDMTITNCTFTANQGLPGSNTRGGAVSNNISAAIITDCQFTGNRATTGAGIYNGTSAAVITGCTFVDCNSTSNDGGGVYNYKSSPTIANCLFQGNVVVANGGTIYEGDSSGSTIVNCLLVNNEAGTYGGAIYSDQYSTSKITNCTICGNSAANRGGGVFNSYGAPSFTNCLIGDNTAPEGPNIYNFVTTEGFQVLANYSDIQGGYPGTRNINIDPNFVDPNAGDFHLAPDSNCIDMGDNAAPGMLAEDYEGSPRIVDGNDSGTATVDLGAYEYQNVATFAVGGAIYADIDAPSTSGVVGVTVTVSGDGGTFGAVTAGAEGLWEVEGVPEGSYTVTPSRTAFTFQYVTAGVPDGQTSIVIDVNEANETANQDIQFLAEGPPAQLHDWNQDGLISIIGDVPPFVQCVYFNDCSGGVDPVAIGDCNGDELISIIGDVPCFVDCVYFGNCPD